MNITLSHSQSRPNWYFQLLIAIALLALALRLAVVVVIPTQPVSDFWSLFTRAISLHDLGTYDAITGRSDATFPPLYPILLSASFSIPLDHLLISKLLNVVLGIFSVIFVSELGFFIGGPKVGIAAGMIQAIYPRSVLMSVLIASENLFIPLLLLWALLTFRYHVQNRSNTPTIIVLGILSGLLTLTRSVAYLVWVLIPLITFARRRPLSDALKELIFLALFMHLVLLPWGIRNYIVLGHFNVLNSTGGVDLFIGNNPNAIGDYYAWQSDIIKQDTQFFQKRILDQDSEARHFAIRWIEKNPSKALSLYFTKFDHMFLNESFVADFSISNGLIEPPWPAAAPLRSDHPMRHYGPMIKNILNYSYKGLLVIEILGLLLTISVKKSQLPFHLRWPVIALFITGLYFPVISAVFLSSTRFRWPFTDLVIPFGAFAILNLELIFSGIKIGRNG